MTVRELARRAVFWGYPLHVETKVHFDYPADSPIPEHRFSQEVFQFCTQLAQVLVDCETGQECEQVFLCDESSIFAPNTVTPNGDGWNDTWEVISDGACWGQWEVRIYNRWGGLVWIGDSITDEWDADVATGTYVYTITAHNSMNAGVFEFNGTITVLY